MLTFANIHTNQAQFQKRTPITTCCLIFQCQYFCSNLRNFVESSTLCHSGSNRLGNFFWHHRLWTEEFSSIPAHTPNTTESINMQNKHVLMRNEGADYWHRTSWNMILFWRQRKLCWSLRRWKEWFFNENRFLNSVVVILVFNFAKQLWNRDATILLHTFASLHRRNLLRPDSNRNKTEQVDELEE